MKEKTVKMVIVGIVDCLRSKELVLRGFNNYYNGTLVKSVVLKEVGEIGLGDCLVVQLYEFQLLKNNITSENFEYKLLIDRNGNFIT